MLKVSIITICRNSSLTLERAILSVLSQTYPNIEYIIIDGNSDDATLHIIRKYEEKIQYWISEPDRGIADAYNKGILHATGDVIGLLNSDDYYLGDHVKQIMHLFDTDKELGFAFGDLEYVNNASSFLYKQIGDPNYITSIRYTMPSIPHPTVFIRRRVYEQVGYFDERYQVAMDYELLLRIVNAGYSGRYIPVSITAMQVGGVSDLHCFSGYRETMQAAVAHGYPLIPAWIYFQYKCLKTRILKGLRMRNYS